MMPPTRVPSAVRTAPVSVARSTIASGSSRDGDRERVGEDEPSLGVGVEHLDRLAAAVRTTSPGFIAEPPGMFSLAGT